MTEMICDNYVFNVTSELYFPKGYKIKPTFLNILNLLQSKGPKLQTLLSNTFTLGAEEVSVSDSELIFEPFFHLWGAKSKELLQTKKLKIRVDSKYKYGLLYVVKQIRDHGPNLTNEVRETFPVVFHRLNFNRLIKLKSNHILNDLLIKKADYDKEALKILVNELFLSMANQYRRNYLELEEEEQDEMIAKGELSQSFIDIYTEHVWQQYEEWKSFNNKLTDDSFIPQLKDMPKNMDMERILQFFYLRKGRKFLTTDPYLLRLMKRANIHKEHLHIFSSTKLKTYVLNKIALQKFGVIVASNAGNKTFFNPLGLKII